MDFSQATLRASCNLIFDIEKLMINNQYVGSGAIHWRGAWTISF